MNPVTVTSPADASQVGARVVSLLDGGQVDEAFALAEALVGDDMLVTHLRAFAFTEGGRQVKSRDRILEGLAGWESLLDKTIDARYNLANAEQALWELSLAETGHIAAMELEHKRLERARRMHEAVAADTAASTQLRLEALVNLGNSYDTMGRDLDALETWSRAVAIDPDFAMARGNVGVALAGVAPFMGEHTPTVVHEAARELDAALEQADEVLRLGGPRALDVRPEQVGSTDGRMAADR